MKRLRERLKIAEYDYPLANILNPKLHQVITEMPEMQTKPKSVKARMTDWRSEHSQFTIITDLAYKYIQRDFLESRIELTCSECWGIIYNDGDYVERHNHEPSYYSFVYYVNTPKGSSHLVFDTSGYKVKAKEGKLVIFDSKLYHHVPTNRSMNRTVISGNFISVGGGVYGI